MTASRVTSNASSSWVDRREFVLGAGAAGIASGAVLAKAYAQMASAPDYSLRIAPLRLELAPGKVIDTFGYNGTVPGPLIRVREGRQVSIDIRNDTDVDDIIHWHGLKMPAASDGAMEEGSPMVERGGAQRYTFAVQPAGTRWYHSHDVAATGEHAGHPAGAAAGQRPRSALRIGVFQRPDAGTR